MTAAEVALAAFALCNSVRVFAYVPQIIAVARDRNGATAISYVTWGLFAVSHVSTVAYAVFTIDDWRMATVFAANAACCVVILAITAIQRARAARTWSIIRPPDDEGPMPTQDDDWYARPARPRRLAADLRTDVAERSRSDARA